MGFFLKIKMEEIIQIMETGNEIAITKIGSVRYKARQQIKMTIADINAIDSRMRPQRLAEPASDGDSSS